MTRTLRRAASAMGCGTTPHIEDAQEDTVAKVRPKRAFLGGTEGAMARSALILGCFSALSALTLYRSA
ncbi:hypothetical protein [Chelatococcus reniformis]|uniref:hypothetical protein n=1 Tax=Chelatococcus reniformis TaxID=1494448 RepID=UPI001AEDFCB2|nr:hypothetical protein [Chelatococcus reniformis]